MKKVWRYDYFYHILKFVEVTEDAPIEIWLPPLDGEGSYIYLETLEKAKEVVQENILSEIRSLNKVLEELLSKTEDNA